MLVEYEDERCCVQVVWLRLSRDGHQSHASALLTNTFACAHTSTSFRLLPRHTPVVSRYVSISLPQELYHFGILCRIVAADASSLRDARERSKH